MRKIEKIMPQGGGRGKPSEFPELAILEVGESFVVEPELAAKAKKAFRNCNAYNKVKHFVSETYLDGSVRIGRDR